MLHGDAAILSAQRWDDDSAAACATNAWQVLPTPCATYLQQRLWLAAGMQSNTCLDVLIMACQALSMINQHHCPCAGRSRPQKLLLHSYMQKGLRR